ncbi:MAG: asparaginase [Ruminiclostridium sp.]|nr:asparaginase [Ruminiclostridium sp.]
MKRILLIGTGGTIASEATDAGLAPGLTTEEFLRYIPAVKDLCLVECMQIFNIDSTNMTPDHWLSIVEAVGQVKFSSI